MQCQYSKCSDFCSHERLSYHETSEADLAQPEPKDNERELRTMLPLTSSVRDVDCTADGEYSPHADRGSEVRWEMRPLQI